MRARKGGTADTPNGVMTPNTWNHGLWVYLRNEVVHQVNLLGDQAGNHRCTSDVVLYHHACYGVQGHHKGHAVHA